MEKTLKSKFIKKIAAVIMIMTILFSLTGCIQYELSFTVHKDGMTDFVFTLALPEVDSAVDILNSYRSLFLSAGFDVEDFRTYEDDMQYVGFKATKKDIYIDDLTDTMKSDLNMQRFFLTKEDDVYFISWNTKSDSGYSNAMNPDGDSAPLINSYGGFAKFNLVVPGKVVESNATSKSGKTLHWDLLETDGFIYAKFTLEGGGVPIWMIASIAGGVLIIGAIITALVLRRKATTFKFTPTPLDQIQDQPSGKERELESWQRSPFPQLNQTSSSESDEDTDTIPTATTPIWCRPAEDQDSDDPQNDLF